MSASSSARVRSRCAAVSHAINARKCSSALVEVCDSDRSAWTSDSSHTAIHCRRSGPSRWPRRFRSIEGRHMKALAAALLVFVAACGQGKAIFNVDVYSFMAGSGKDTIPYVIPPSASASASTFQRILLPPGFGGSIVDSVRITTGNANLINSAGTGTIGLQFRFAADSAGTIAAPAALNIPATSVTGAQTVPVAISGDLSSTINRSEEHT